MDTASESFGRRLKSQRERRGIRLETIAASTKIKASLLADLERDDVSKWPQGIFRRAFVREYAASVGLAPDPIIAEFVRLFPDESSSAGGSRATSEAAPDLRLTLVDAGRAPLGTRALQAAAAFLEMCAIVALAGILAWSTGLSFWTICGAASLAYYALASAWCGRSPASWWLHGGGLRARGHERGRARDLLGLLVERAQIHQGSDRRRTIQTHAAAADSLQPASGAIVHS